MKSDLSLQDMLDEIKVIIDADLHRLKGIFGTDIVRASEDQKIDNMPITEQMLVLFDYVVNARLPHNFPLSDVLQDVTDYFLETVPRSPLIDLYRLEPIEGICEWIVNTAVVRWGLDFEEIGAFSIKQLATLANMDERSVRNAANPKNSNPLKTFRQVDGSTMVTRDDATEWLTGRRSYKPTTFIDESGERDLEHDGFKDLLNLGLYIKNECERHGKQLNQILREAGLEREYAAWQAGNSSDRLSFDVDRFRSLAVAIGKDERIFTMAAYKAWQKAELTWLEIKLRS